MTTGSNNSRVIYFDCTMFPSLINTTRRGCVILLASQLHRTEIECSVRGVLVCVGVGEGEEDGQRVEGVLLRGPRDQPRQHPPERRGLENISKILAFFKQTSAKRMVNI